MLVLPADSHNGVPKRAESSVRRNVLVVPFVLSWLLLIEH